MLVGEIIMLITGLVRSLATAIPATACVCNPFTENYQNRKKNLHILKSQMRKLKRLKIDLDERLSGNEIFGDDLYISRRAAVNLLREVEGCHFDDEIDQRCLGGCLPNCCARYSNGKRILEMIKKVEDILQEFEEGSIPHELLTKRGMIQPSTRLIGFQADEKVELIWKFLKRGNNINIIGVHGVGGVGKTSIVTKIHNRALKEKRKHNSSIAQQSNNPDEWFDFVFWVNVPSESNMIQNLQKSIAAAVNIELPEDIMNVTTRAVALSNAMMKKGSYLLILDDMWTTFSLRDIGIPEPTIENGCKIIITSRSAAVCRSMKTDKDVQVELLSEDDAWALFAEEARIDLRNMSGRSQTTAQHVSEECGCLPLAIITVASSLRNVTDHYLWDRTLITLKEYTANAMDMDEKVFQRLRFSYDRLTVGGKSIDIIAQSCFLYCSLYPKGYHINTKELIECWIWEGLTDLETKSQRQMNLGRMILDKLKDVRLIEGVSQEDGIEHVIMHHLIRDMAIGITVTEPRFLIRAGARERQPPGEWPQYVQRVSLMRNDLKGFHNKPECHHLRTLLLQYNYSLSYLCYDFFAEMPLLRVLNLSYTGIPFLPDVSRLNNLRALLLSNCWKLDSLPSLQGLRALMALDLSCTGITQVPDELAQLINLRRLDLSYTKVRIFEPQLLRVLRRLEELLMYGCLFFWGEECIKELQHSLNLVVLEMNFKNKHVFDTYIKSDHCDQLKSFKFCVGEIYGGTMGDYGISITENFHVNGFPVFLPDQTTDLHMSWCEDRTQLQITSQRKITSQLKNLKVLDISDCGNLKILFKPTVLLQLPNLQQIAIIRCHNMEKVIDDEKKFSDENKFSYDTQTISLGQIKTLTLVDLPKLESIYDGKVEWNYLQTIEVLRCENLKRIPLPPDGLITIRGEETWFKSLEWKDPNSQIFLERCFEAARGAPEEHLSRQTACTSSNSETAELIMSTGKEIVEDTGDNSEMTPTEAGSSSGLKAIATGHRSCYTGIEIIEEIIELSDEDEVLERR